VSFWPFNRKPEPPAIIDRRQWNDDWKVGDTAECVADPTDRRWDISIPPWERPALGQRFTVVGFSEGIGAGGHARFYFLALDGWPSHLSTQCFRKVKPVASEQSEIVAQILNAKPGKDRTRKTPALTETGRHAAPSAPCNPASDSRSPGASIRSAGAARFVRPFHDQTDSLEAQRDHN